MTCQDRNRLCLPRQSGFMYRPRNSASSPVPLPNPRLYAPVQRGSSTLPFHRGPGGGGGGGGGGGVSRNGGAPGSESNQLGAVGSPGTPCAFGMHVVISLLLLVDALWQACEVEGNFAQLCRALALQGQLELPGQACARLGLDADFGIF